MSEQKPWESFGQQPANTQSRQQTAGERPWEGFGGETQAEGRGFTGHVRDLGLSALKSAIAVPETVVGMGDLMTGGRTGKAAERLGFRPREAKEALSALHTDQYKEQAREFQEADGVFDKAGVALSNPSMVANTVVESLGPMGLGGAAGRGLGMAGQGARGAVGAASAGEGLAMAGAQAEQIRQESDDGLLTTTQSAYAGSTGALGALFGLAGGQLARKLGIGDVDTMLARGVTPDDIAGSLASSSSKSVPRQIIEGAITEGFLEELPQSVSEQILQNLALDKHWAEGVDDAIVMGTLAGMAMGGSASGVSGVAQSFSADDPPKTATGLPPATDPSPPGGGDTLASTQAAPATSTQPVELPATPVPRPAITDPVTRIRLPSEKMGLDPAAGPMSSAAATAVDSGASAQMAAAEQAVQQGDQPAEQQAPLADAAGTATAQTAAEQTPATVAQAPATPLQQSQQQRPEQAMLDIEGVDAETGEVSPEARAAEIEQRLTFIRTQARNAGWDKRLGDERRRLETELSTLRPEDPASPGAQWRAMSHADRKKLAGETDLKPIVRKNVHTGDWDTLSAGVREKLEGAIQARTTAAAQERAAAIDDAGKQAATSPENSIPEPTEAQKEAGNYPKGHTRLHGLEITIENPRGSTRSGTRPDGSTWSHEMSDHYGYIRRTTGADAEQMDVYLGPQPDAQQVFIVDQLDQQTGQFDEHKVMMGYPDLDTAVAAYSSNFDAGWQVGPVRAMPVSEFKTWLKEGDTSRPASEFGAPMEDEQAAPSADMIDQSPDGTVGQGQRVSAGTISDTSSDQVRATESENTDAPPSPTADTGQAGQQPDITGAGEAAPAAPAAADGTDLTSEDVADQTSARKPRAKPRMGESADDVWSAIKQASGGVVSTEGGSRLLYPTLRVVAGDSFRLDANGDLQIVDQRFGGVGVRPATTAEADEFHNDLNGDRVEVVLMSAPGYGSDYKNQKVMQVLHSPSGMSFEQSSQAGTESKAPAADDADRESATVAGWDEQAERIEDFGEKLAGARKDEASKLRDAMSLDVAAVPLSKSWPEPDYQKLLSEGVDAWRVAAIRAMRDEVPTKPQKAYRLNRWVQQVQELRNFASEILSSQETADSARTHIEAIDALADLRGRIELYQAVGHDHSLKGITLSSGAYTVYDGVQHNPAKTVWEVRQKAKKTAFTNMPRRIAHGDTKQEAINRFAEAVASGRMEKAGRQTRFDIYQYRQGEKAGKWVIGKKIGREYVDLADFDTVAKARAHLAENSAGLEAKLARFKDIPDHRLQNNSPRLGVDHRNGQDVTPELFSETFGFRGVQFGNYVEQGRRQQDLNQAFDALMDLAGILNLPPRAISLGGELGLAFGARGRGKQGRITPAAHYESGHIVINLTKKAGAGTLAHEWWHALDNYFTRERGGSSDRAFATEGATHISVRPEVAAAFREVTKTINLTRMRERSRVLDRAASKAYWSTGREMSARAFESYVIERLRDQSASNDYLANVVGEDYWNAAAQLGLEKENSYPYPEAAELPEIRAAFDSFFQTVETREEAGKTVLFSRRGASRDPGRPERAAWGSFPPVIRNGDLGQLNKLPQYEAAKAGDARSALDLVESVITDDFIQAVREAIGDQRPIVVPVIAEEASGRNKIPHAFAEVLASRLGLETSTEIMQVRKAARTGQGAYHRLAYSPGFDGPVQQGQSYLIVDDTLTMGGTLASLRGFIENKGGRVVRAAVLTAHEGALSIPVTEKMLRRVRAKHGEALEQYWQSEFGYGLDQTTQGEAGHLRAAPDVDAIRDRIAEARREAGERLDEAGTGAPEEQQSSVNSPGPDDGPDFSFAGRRARGADINNLRTAQERLANGEDVEAVRLETGWHRGVDGKWRYEITDDQADLRHPGGTFGDIYERARQASWPVTVGDVMSHSHLYAAYPDLAAIPLEPLENAGRTRARFVARPGAQQVLVRPDLPRDRVVSALLHELQHAIQMREGFASGGSVKGASEWADGADVYRRLAGEVEARNTQARRRMTPEFRQAFPPQATADVSAADVIVTINGKRIHEPPKSGIAGQYRPVTPNMLALSMEMRFPELVPAVRKMLARGKKGERGGVVVIDSADPLMIAREFSRRTGTALSESIQLFDGEGSINGFHDSRSGLTFLVGPNLDPRSAPAVLLHEMIHGRQRADIDSKALSIIMERGNLKDANQRAFLDRVAARMTDAGETANAQEAAAYIVEVAVEEGISNGYSSADNRFYAFLDGTFGKPVGNFVRQFVAMVRQWMLRHGMPIGQISVHDLVEYAKAGLQQTGQADASMQFSRAVGEQTQTAAFKRWFGDSKAVDAEGQPRRMYHGTAADFDSFALSKAKDRDGRRMGLGWGKGKFYFAETGEAASSAASFAQATGRGNQQNVMPVYLSVQKPMAATEYMAMVQAEIDKGKSRDQAIAAVDRVIKREGYDGIIDGESGGIAVFRPEQIKSAIGNAGTFDPANPDILFSRSGVRRLGRSAVQTLNSYLSHPGKVSWWHKSIGTMYNLAQRAPAFKPVFNAAQGFIEDVAYYAADASELAPKLLPRLETWRDILKSAISADDSKAISRPIFEGTLSWTRDVDGQPVRLDDLEARAAGMTIDEKAKALVDNGQLPESMLRAWRGLGEAQFAANVNSRYASQMMKPGVVWSDAELKSIFDLNDEQVGLYREFRAATDRSLDTMARADMMRFGGDDLAALRDQVMDAADITAAAVIIRNHLTGMARSQPSRETSLMQLMHGITERAERVRELQAEGYAPLSRFGKYTVDVVVNGERQYFSLFETKREANQMAARMREEFGESAVSQGTLSDEAYKLFAGVTPESLELFGNMLGLQSTGDDAQDQAFQEYLRLTKTNRSAMRRLIHRKGIAGYSEDVGRVLASFVYSNARQTAAGLHMGDLAEAINDIPVSQGELKDVAIRLAEYIKNPQEEAQVIRGLLFAQYLGGSVASAFVNMTQPVAVTLPWLSQFGGARRASAAIARAAKDMATRGKKYEADLAAALKDAEDDGVVSPQEIHQLMAQARGSGSLRAGDGTRVGEGRAMASNAVTRLSVAWGKMFGAAEQLNRRITFIAAYRMARENGMADPAAFAREAVVETQFTYSKANKMRWGRGAVGGTVMTFKTYSVAYIELMHRLWTQGGPEGKKAAMLMMATLMLMGGAGGLPFAEDIEDAIDGLAQLMGYNFSARKAKEQFLQDVFGDAMARFIDKGVSGLPGAPMDVSGRLGLGNLIPGTGLLQERTSHTRDVLEFVGPMGDFGKRVFSGAGQILGGIAAGSASEIGAGLMEMSPVAVRNALKGGDMVATGMYRDTKGYKVLDTNHLEAALKAVGFQPNSVAEIQEANWLNQRAKNFYNLRAQEIRATWAAGIFENSPAKVQRAREMVAEWNRKNPAQPMIIRIPDVMRRVREMGKDKDQRIAATAPRAMRAQMREDLLRARGEPAD